MVLNMKNFAKQLNNLTFTDYYFRLELLAKSVFKWENLPNGINEKWIEDFLYENGKCVFYEDSKRGLMLAECNLDGNLNNYNEATSLSPTGIDIPSNKLTPGKDCVLVRNNDKMLSTKGTLMLFAYRLAEISRTIDVNINAQKTPVVIVSNNKKLLSMKNLYSKVDENEVALYVDNGLDLDAIKALNMEARVVFPELQQHKLAIWNECLTFLGINNANTEKRERLITEEVSANNEHIDLSADCFLKAREQAAEEINKIFGCNISVRKRKESEIKCMQGIPNISET